MTATYGEVPKPAEGDGLENREAGNTRAGVRIPPSPPTYTGRKGNGTMRTPVCDSILRGIIRIALAKRLFKPFFIVKGRNAGNGTFTVLEYVSFYGEDFRLAEHADAESVDDVIRRREKEWGYTCDTYADMLKNGLSETATGDFVLVKELADMVIGLKSETLRSRILTGLFSHIRICIESEIRENVGPPAKKE